MIVVVDTDTTARDSCIGCDVFDDSHVGDGVGSSGDAVTADGCGMLAKLVMVTVVVVADSDGEVGANLGG
ncbi:DNA-directed RNA polymerase II subunit 1 [Iris pallida]|uniref:DNA-directed RNA polymerase II subunit 1 n=1 Tax=Iris pallida TaxID=29817 RepID=A0AAX6GSC1_IRIPA|nr:DNA-directed RNA polymerase II subunit 1 [Iris pallida]KAJ6831225.1 DNA-directed RNA polymerase II subunit 1 [Iris pallida]